MPGASTDSTCPGSGVPASDAFSPATRLSSTSVVLPGARHAGHAGQTPFRNARLQRMHGVDGVGLQRDGSFVEKMLGRDGRAHPHLRRACQKRPDAAGRVRFHLGHRPLGDDAAAVGARAGADLDEVVRVAQHGHVVIHHHHGVAVGQKVVHDARAAPRCSPGAARWRARPARRGRRWCGCARRA